MPRKLFATFVPNSSQQVRPSETRGFAFFIFTIFNYFFSVLHIFFNSGEGRFIKRSWKDGSWKDARRSIRMDLEIDVSQSGEVKLVKEAQNFEAAPPAQSSSTCQVLILLKRKKEKEKGNAIRGTPSSNSSQKK